MTDTLHTLLSQAAQSAYPTVALPEFRLTQPQDPKHGNYTATLGLALAKVVQSDPMTVANSIIDHLPPIPEVQTIQAVQPGYINIFLTPESMWRAVLDHQAEKIELSADAATIVFEYGQPNTHKVPHIGHLYSYCVGESYVRMLAGQGYRMIRTNYQGDIGPHVAKCIWAYLRNNQPDPETLNQKVAYLQQCYQQGAGAYEDDPEAKKEIDALNTQLYSHDPDIMPTWHKTRQWSLDYYREFEARLGIYYDRSYLESEIYERGVTLVRENTGTVFEEHDGAVIFRGESYGLHTRVFINNRGNPTYEAKEVGLIEQKWRDFNFDRSIVETGNDQSDYWRVLKTVGGLIFPELQDKLMTLHHGLINLSTGKMSSRTGQILTAFSLVDLVKERVRERMQTSSKSTDFLEEEAEQVVEQIALGAIKYSFLRSTPGKDIAFDLETSIAHEGNSGPYLQYTYARCRSLLASKIVDHTAVEGINFDDAELTLVHWLYQYYDIKQRAALEYAPHMMCAYLFELAQRFSYFYNQNRILGHDRENQRLALVTVVSQVLKDGLNLLGIDTPERI